MKANRRKIMREATRTVEAVRDVREWLAQPIPEREAVKLPSPDLRTAPIEPVRHWGKRGYDLLAALATVAARTDAQERF